MAAERTKYADTILIGKQPLEASEIIRLRLSQAKLINKEFYLLFRELSDLKRNYAQQLRSVIAKNEDLEKLLMQDMLETRVLTIDELRDFRFDSLGELKGLWNGLFNGLRLELQSSTDFYHLLDRSLIADLKDSTEKDPLWSQSRKLHSALCKTAAEHDQLIKNSASGTVTDAAKLRQVSDQWDTQAADLFEIFEKTDYRRLLGLKNCLLKYESGLSDTLDHKLHSSEESMARILEFDPEAEIDRFAQAAAAYDFKFKVPTNTDTNNKANGASGSFQRLPSSSEPQNKSSQGAKTGHGALGGLASRLSSTGTVIKHDLMKTEFSDSTNNKSLETKKSSNKLRSKMGSIFGRKKLKNKKSGMLQENTIAENETSSVRTGESILNANGNSTLGSEPRTYKQSVADSDSANVQEPLAVPPKPTFAATSSTLSINQPSLKPQPRDRTSTSEPHSSNIASPAADTSTLSTSGSSPMGAPGSTVATSNVSPSAPKTSQPIHIQAPQVPAPPPSRKTVQPVATSFSRGSHGSVPAPATSEFTRESHGARPPAASTTKRADIQSKLFTDLSQADIDAQQNKRQSSISSQMTGELRTLNPQTTGSSLSMPLTTGQSIFHHSELTSFGLNASVAEVISATFKEGVLSSSQLIGEIALNFVADSDKLPIEINLRMNNFKNSEKVIVNQAFIEQVGTEVYKINPLFIHSKTLGAFKYALSNPVAPIVIHPVWRFEDHQASVALTLGIAPTVDEAIQELSVEELTVFVSIEGATPTSALSKPQGSFSKEKKRITWRFKDPLTIKRGGDERLIARFLTEGKAHESAKGVGAKFTIKNYHLGSALELESQEVDVNDPFSATAEWKPVIAKRTLVAGNYMGLS
ncbi:LANO_0G03664g1_1 [Lachancea nothofagi CBS 11611]|uniref:LANO_0G03664g1_1 n=1 Tax=Lachancea nothofagi CBS 11611 TaxID=1266666 RepID=A0A1G4KFT4_9SACH|nr:LANO_0G03664g1_1 [Lachancea nothofagi CBS 11611]